LGQDSMLKDALQMRWTSQVKAKLDEMVISKDK
jgi:hypothetical protein